MSYLAERRLEEKERRRLEILEAAVEVAGVVGFEAMTMEQVARKARLSRALVYVYFKDKHDLQTYFNIKLEKILAKYNKSLVGWEEIMTEAPAAWRVLMIS